MKKFLALIMAALLVFSCVSAMAEGWEIVVVPKDASNPRSLKIPVIDTERCIGCGACENLCPSRPFSAIYVEGHEVHRTL